MTERTSKVGAVLRFLASGGMADEGASAATRQAAQTFLDELQSDAFAKY